MHPQRVRQQTPQTAKGRTMTTAHAKYYRARIVLEEVTPKPTADNSSYRDTIIDEIAEISVKGGSPGHAMNQIVAHAQELAATHADITIAPGSWAAGVFVPVDPVAVKGTVPPPPKTQQDPAEA
jgi:hypothetical protein